MSSALISVVIASEAKQGRFVPASSESNRPSHPESPCTNRVTVGCRRPIRRAIFLLGKQKTGAPRARWRVYRVMAMNPHILDRALGRPPHRRSEEHTSELQSLMRISYAVFCLKKKTQ